MRTRLWKVLLIGASACATSSGNQKSDGATPPAQACPTTCASVRDACLTQAGPAPKADDPKPKEVNSAEWNKRFEQQKATAACGDNYQGCIGACSK